MPGLAAVSAECAGCGAQVAGRVLGDRLAVAEAGDLDVHRGHPPERGGGAVGVRVEHADTATPGGTAPRWRG